MDPFCKVFHDTVEGWDVVSVILSLEGLNSHGACVLVVGQNGVLISSTQAHGEEA